MGNVFYHVSYNKLSNNILHPKLPDNFFTRGGYEENKTPRVCMSTNINGCLRGMSQNLKGKELYVYKIDNINTEFIVPTTKDVPDRNITKEIWFIKPVKVKYVGIIKINDSVGDGLEFKYADKTAELYDWDWEWLKKE